MYGKCVLRGAENQNGRLCCARKKELGGKKREENVPKEYFIRHIGRI